MTATLFNEWHATNTSKKIRAVIVSNAKQGKYHAPIAAYGYLVSNTDDRRPVIDENTAPNVRRIFKMRSEGASSLQIAKALNMCNNYANHGKTVCTSHHILQRVIEGLVLADKEVSCKSKNKKAGYKKEECFFRYSYSIFVCKKVVSIVFKRNATKKSRFVI